jgi:hypothetical protein
VERTSKAEWANWKEHPVTEAFFAKLKESREELIARLPHNTDSAPTQNFLIGNITAITKILEVDFEE